MDNREIFIYSRLSHRSGGRSRLVWTSDHNENVSSYFYGAEGLLWSRCNGEYQIYHYDYRGSVVAVTDIDGNVTDTLKYDAYGSTIERTGDSALIFGYNGQYGVLTDPNGLLYMRTRFYNPQLKRFMNADIIDGSIADSTSLNLYTFVNGNPISFVDPFGLSAERANAFDYNNRNSLCDELSSQVKRDLNFVEYHKNVFFYDTEEALDIVLEYDALITQLSNKYGLQKEMIQTILFRELRFTDARDYVADSFVIETYVYMTELEKRATMKWWQLLLAGQPEAPTHYSEDSSTGYGQIFASTAITAINYAVNEGLIDWDTYNYNDMHQRYGVWKKLKDDNAYNIEVLSLVLIWSANDVGLSNDYYSYSDQDVKSMFARYNGTGNAAAEYGREALGWYNIFKKYN